MNEIIEQLEAAIAASYGDMKGFGWIPMDSVVPDRHSESFIDLVQTRLVVFSGMSFGQAMELTFKIKTFLDKQLDSPTQPAKLTTYRSKTHKPKQRTIAMTTLAQAVTKIVADSIDQDYIAKIEKDEDDTLRYIYMAEYGNWNGCTPAACKGYLQGLPTVCTIPFYNGEILELLAAQGIVRKSEAAQANLIDAYWETAGQCFYKLVK